MLKSSLLEDSDGDFGRSVDGLITPCLLLECESSRGGAGFDVRSDEHDQSKLSSQKCYLSHHILISRDRVGHVSFSTPILRPVPLFFKATSPCTITSLLLMSYTEQSHSILLPRPIFWPVVPFPAGPWRSLWIPSILPAAKT